VNYRFENSLRDFCLEGFDFHFWTGFDFEMRLNLALVRVVIELLQIHASQKTLLLLIFTDQIQSVPAASSRIAAAMR